MKQADAVNHQRVNAVETAVRLNLASAMTSPMLGNDLKTREIGRGGLDRALQLRRRRLETGIADQRPEVRVAYQRYKVPVGDERHEA
jgi:hypothetical protein